MLRKIQIYIQKDADLFYFNNNKKDVDLFYFNNNKKKIIHMQIINIQERDYNNHIKKKKKNSCCKQNNN